MIPRNPMYVIKVIVNVTKPVSHLTCYMLGKVGDKQLASQWLKKRPPLVLHSCLPCQLQNYHGHHTHNTVRQLKLEERFQVGIIALWS